MAEAPAREQEEAGPRPALKISASATTPGFSFSFSLKIPNYWPLAAGGLSSQEKDEITVTTDAGVGRRLTETAAPFGEQRHSRTITKGPQGKGLEPMSLSKDLTAGCIDSEMVQDAITSRNIEAHSPQADLLDDIALKPDDQSPVLANWSSLAARSGVPRKTFKQFERRSVQSPTHNMFGYLAVARPHLTLKALKDALELMNRNDLLKILRNQDLRDEVRLKDVMTRGSELLQMVADKLNIDAAPWHQNWRNLAYLLKIPSDLYQEFDETSERRTSPTKELMRWLTVRSPGITLIDIVKARRNDAIENVTEEFPDVFDWTPAFVRARGEKALAAYNRALDAGRTTDKRVKVLLVGQDRVGKTSLSKYLRGETFDESEPSTEGVTMIPPVKNAGTDAWRNPAHLKGTDIFDHKMTAKITKLMSSKLSEPSLKRPMETDVADDQVPMSEEAVREDVAEENLPERQLIQRQNTQQENVEENPDEEKSLVGQHTHHQINHQENVEENLKQKEPLRAAQKKEEVMPEGVASLLEQVENNEFEVDQDDKIWTVIWDFAGQDLYRAIHPIFMSPDDIYLLVFDLSKRLTDLAKCRVNENHKEHTVDARDSEDTNLDHLLRWMDLIHSLETRSASQLPHPPVILVGTHADLVTNPIEEMESVNTKCSAVLQAFADHIVRCLAIDNTKAGIPADQTDQKDVQNLRTVVLDLADKMPHTKKEIPLQWHRVEKEISKEEWQEKNYLTRKKFQELVLRYCTFDDEDDFDELVHFLHARGSIVYHEHEGDRDGLVVLNSQWLINVLCEIIKVKSPNNEEPYLRRHREKLKDEGILSRKLLDHACRNQNLDPIKESLISLMEKFNLIFEWPATETEDSLILVPCVLTSKGEGGDAKEEMTSTSTAPVYVTFNETNYVPSALFCQLVVLFGKMLSLKYTRDYRLHANEASFPLDADGHSLLLVCYKTVIKVCIKGPGDSIPSEHCRNVLWHLQQFMETLREECHWLRSMSWQVSLLCTICLEKRVGDNEPCMRHEKEKACVHHDCAEYIPLKTSGWCARACRFIPRDKLHPWIEVWKEILEATAKPGTSSEGLISAAKRKSSCDTFCTLAKQKKLVYADLKEGNPSEYELALFSEKLGDSWERFARCLGFDDAAITGFYRDYSKQAEKASGMLLQWRQREGADATYCVLYDALCDKLVERRDLAESFCCSKGSGDI